jgi:toxin ParE1/3/4
MAKIIWTEKAVSHIKGIYEYIARDSKVYAINFISSLIKAVEQLELLPYMGRRVPEFKEYNLREILYKSYRIVYRISKSGDIEILAIIHGAKDFNKAIRE